jgi:hypothetical protein
MLNKDMTIHNLGGGAVLFKNAINIPQDEIIAYLQNRQEVYKKQNFKIVNDADGNPSHAVNEGGFRYELEDIDIAPIRIQQLDHPFFRECEDALYQALIRYIEIFPALLQCIWWKSGGHVLCYNKGGKLGFHCDNDVNYTYDNPPKKEHATRNVVSALIYFNDCVEDDDEPKPHSFSGGHMTLPYFDIDIKPAAGDIFLMPANYLGAHEIHQVTSGSRYSYLGWYAQGSEHPEKGINPNKPQEIGLVDGQWWIPSILQDYENYVVEKYGGLHKIPQSLMPFSSRKKEDYSNES